MKGNAPALGRTPVLLTSLTSAALLDGGGDFTWVQETRGAPFDWGGVYGQLVRLTGPWRVELSVDGASADLPSTRVESAPVPGGWRSRHRWADLEVVQDVAAIAEPAGAVRRLRIVSSRAERVRVHVVSRFSPYLLPVLVEGVRPIHFGAEARGGMVRVQQHGFVLRVSSAPAPVRQSADGVPLGLIGHDGPIQEIMIEHDLDIAPGATVEVRWQIVGGIARDLAAAERKVGDVPLDPEVVAANHAEADRAWLAGTPELSFPDAPDLEAGYRSARAALRKLYTAPGEGLVGLVAGYPWYSAIWCRDLGIMLPAVLWLGDAEWVERSLTSVFRFQSQKMVEILGGQPGELPMQIAPGPIFLYGTSDTTLRFPTVVDLLHAHAGDTGSIREWAEAIHRIVEWGRARVDPESGFLRHGGEAEGIETATATLSNVRYGIDSPDTTIWDSADRRDMAVDVQVLWWRALVATARLMTVLGDSERALACRESAALLARAIPAAYVRPDGEYLFDTIRAGRPVDQVRPNALRVVSAGLLDEESSLQVVHRAARPDLTTDWGLRTLSSDDPAYDPQAYHGGQVWTIATAWAADAALVAGDPDLAMRYLRMIVRHYDAEQGFAHECYRGDRPEPYDSCYLLGFSLAPFLTLLFERLWGISMDALADRMEVRPRFPADWKSARLENLRLGPGRVALEWSPGRVLVRWTGPGNLTVTGPDREVAVTSGASAVLELPSEPSGP